MAIYSMSVEIGKGEVKRGDIIKVGQVGGIV